MDRVTSVTRITWVSSVTRVTRVSRMTRQDKTIFIWILYHLVHRLFSKYFLYHCILNNKLVQIAIVTYTDIYLIYFLSSLLFLILKYSNTISIFGFQANRSGDLLKT